MSIPNLQQGTDSYEEQFKREVISYDEMEGIGHAHSFEMRAYDRTPEREIGELVPVHVSDRVGSVNVGVDGYRYDDDDGTLVLSIVDFRSFDADSPKLAATEATALLNRLANFFKTCRSSKINDALEIDFSTPEYDLIELIQTRPIERVRFLIFTDRQVSARLRKLEVKQIEDIPVEADLWDISRLEEEDKRNSSDEPIEYDFSESPLELTLSTEGEGYRAFIGRMPAQQLAQMYKRNGSRLLEGNVRSFLSMTSRVNKKIRETLLRCPEKFFILNNGIAATASNLKFNAERQIVGATDFQIVNGGQTTATIAQVVYKEGGDVSRASVVVKLTEMKDMSQDAAGQLIQEISRASNTQNPVSDADFFSNNPFHREMEQISDRTIAPAVTGLAGTYWYYERARGAYKQKRMYFKRKSEIDAFERKYPKNQVITKEALARVWLCWENRQEGPSLVSKGAAALFKKYGQDLDQRWESKKKTGDFGDDYWKETVALTILLREIKSAVKDEEWYCKGYLANIAAYAMAVLADHVRSEWGSLKSFNLQRIWQRQGIAPSLQSVLCIIGHGVQDALIDSAQGNVTQWCKKEACWNAVRSAFDGQKLLSEIEQEYRIGAEQISRRKTARAAQNRMDSKLMGSIEASQFQHWKDAYDFHKAHAGILTDSEAKALYDIALRRKYQDRTCKTAFAALDKLREEGFRH